MTDSTNDRVSAPASAPGAPLHDADRTNTDADRTNADRTNADRTDSDRPNSDRTHADRTNADRTAADPEFTNSEFADAEPEAGPPAAEKVSIQTVRVRRTPRYARFALVGALVCIAAAFILTYSFPQGAGYDRNTVFGFMIIVAVTVGVALGCIAALIAERVTSRRAHTVAADRIDVSSTPAIRSADDATQGTVDRPVADSGSASDS
jgi:hypothetical protein